MLPSELDKIMFQIPLSQATVRLAWSVAFYLPFWQQHKAVYESIFTSILNLINSKKRSQRSVKKKNSFENGGWMAPLYFVPRSHRAPLWGEPHFSGDLGSRWVFVGASIIPQVNAILYSLLLFDEEGLYNQGISNVFGYFPSIWIKCRYRNQLEFTRRVTCSLQLLFYLKYSFLGGAQGYII